jgi:hypothetical protein
MPETPASDTQLGSATPANPEDNNARATGPAYSLASSARVFRNFPVADDFGTFTDNWIEIGTLACRLLKQLTQEERVEGGQRKALSKWRAGFDLNAGFIPQPQDALILDGLLYQILETDEGLTQAAALTAILARKNRITGLDFPP